MDIIGHETYPVDLEATWDLLTDRDVAVARYEAAGHTDIEVLEWGDEGDDFVMKTKRVVRVDLPGFAKKVLKPVNTMVQTERWGPVVEGTRKGTFQVDVEGAPVKIEGTTKLTTVEGGTTRHEVNGRLDVKVPLIGGKIANWAGGDAKRELDAELAFNRERLTP